MTYNFNINKPPLFGKNDTYNKTLNTTQGHKTNQINTIQKEITTIGTIEHKRKKNYKHKQLKNAETI